jgi:hypothetical protein
VLDEKNFLRSRKPGDLPGNQSRRQLDQALDYVRKNPGGLSTSEWPRDKIFWASQLMKGFVSLNTFCVVLDDAWHFAGLYSEGRYISIDGKYYFESSEARKIHRKNKLLKKKEAVLKWKANSNAS